MVGAAWTALGIALVIVARGAWVGAWSGPLLARGERAYTRGDWPRAVALADQLLADHPNDPLALRLRARGLARLGRNREARAIAPRLGARWVEAEDLFLIGRGLLGEGRTALGWAALEAASRLDLRHRETVSALAVLRGKPEASGDIAALVERLAAIGNAPALGQLVLGLVAITTEDPTPGGIDPALARVTRLGRARLARVDSPGAAQNLVARLLLEDGKARAARAWLERPANRSLDREALWLLSRALLVGGDIDGAAAALRKAGLHARDDPTAPEPARYLGSKRCASCHGAIARIQQASRHATTLTKGTALTSLPYPDRPLKDPEEPTVCHRFERSDGAIRVTVDVNGELFRAVVEYALGSGHHGVSLIGREESGGHRALRLSYYPPARSWAVTGGFDPHPIAPAAYLGELLTDEALQSCLGCHDTHPGPHRARDAAVASDRGIRCERCHGPGDHHVRAVESGFPDLAIGRPKRATPAQRGALCAQCHGANGEIPPSDPRFIRFQSTTLAYSRCATESGGRLDCVGCHDPHGNLATRPAHYEARCLACHGGGARTVSEPLALRLEPVSASACPVNAAKGCLDCHMPVVAGAMPFSSFTDHHIRVRRPLRAARP